MKYLANKFYTFFFFSMFVLSSYADSQVSISMLDSDPASITLAFTSADIQSSDIIIEDQLYQNIHMPGTGSTHDPSKPQVPFRGVLLAVPDSADIEVELLDFELETFAGYLLAPFTDEQKTFDEAAYNTDEFWPKSPVELGIVGYIRDQRVAQIQFYPVQYNPVREEIKVYKRMHIRVSFSGGSMANTVSEDSFDRLLARLLINDGDINRVVQPKQQSSICPEPNAAFKVLVEKDGMYALGYDDLVAAGMDIDNIDPRFIQMTHRGVEVPIQITGEKDGHFDRKDKLIFYGEAMTGVFTRTNVYWLSLNPQGGARMAVRKSKHRKKGWRNAPRLNSFRTTARMEMDAIYWSYLPNGEGQDHWFWEELEGGQSLDMSVSLDNRADSSEMAIVRVMLYGKSNDYAHNPDHHTKVFLNGNEIDDVLWDGQGNFIHEVTVPHESLLDGENIVTLSSVGDTEAVVDKLYVNYVEIDFINSYTAENGQLKFEAEGNGKYIFDVGNFTRKKVSVFDVTEPYDVVRIKKVEVDDGFSLRFGEKLDGKRTYLAQSFPTKQFLKPSSIELDDPSILKSACHSADYIIIYHESFDVSELESIVSDRGFEVMTVKVSDIYDEFNHGIFNPKAIKDFLSYAYENYGPLRPSYVVLVGDANQDYMNRLGYGINYVPTHLFQTYLLGDTASDNWFVSVSGDDPLPDMFLGRISVRIQTELDAIVAKMVSYEENVPVDGWNQNVLLVADDEQIFEDVSDRLAQDYLGDYNANKVYLSSYPNTGAATEAVIDYFDAGAILTNYTGHGNVDKWAKIFHSSNVASLNNPDRLSFVMALDCLNGWFSYHKDDYTLADEFLRAAQKGAIGVWAPTGLGYTSQNNILARELFNDLFIEKEIDLGVLTTGAKISAVVNYGISTDNLEIFTLFGEPTTWLQLD
jgi:hypothetical protein